MSHSKSAQAIGSKEVRINVCSDRDTRSRSIRRNIGAESRGTSSKAAAPASSVASRLEQAARIAFHLGGED